MKIYLIRHAKVNYKWPGWCDSNGFDEACAEYDEADILECKEQDLMWLTDMWHSLIWRLLQL